MIHTYKARAPTRNTKTTQGQLSKSFLATKGSETHATYHAVMGKAKEIKPSKTPVGQAISVKASYSSFNPNLRKTSGATPTKLPTDVPQDLSSSFIFSQNHPSIFNPPAPALSTHHHQHKHPHNFITKKPQPAASIMNSTTSSAS